MRFKLSKNRFYNEIDITYNSVVVIWVDSIGNVGIDRHRQHPLTRVYWNICRDNRLQAVKTDIDSRKVALILFASLVLL